MLLSAFTACVRQLKPGVKLSAVHEAVRAEFAAHKKEHLLPHLSASLGAGIGLNVFERLHSIEAHNDREVTAGSSFCVRMQLKDLPPTKSCSHKHTMQLADTVFVGEKGDAQVLTGEITKLYNDVSYTLEEEEEKQEASPVKGQKTAEEIIRSSRATTILPTKTRGKAKEQMDDEGRKAHQDALQNEKIVQMKLRFENGEIRGEKKKEKTKDMKLLNAYESEQAYPRRAKPGKIFVDSERDAILIPKGGGFVPIHLALVKSSSISTHAQWAHLRINLFCPGIANLNSSRIFPQPEGPMLFIKELTLKSTDAKDLANTDKLIKDALKKKKTKDLEAEQRQDYTQQEALVTTKGKRLSFERLVIRPSI